MDNKTQTSSNPIQKARRAAGLTVDQLAARAGVTWRAVLHWEHGDFEPSGRNLVRLSEILGVPERDLLSPQPPAPSGEAA